MIPPFAAPQVVPHHQHDKELAADVPPSDALTTEIEARVRLLPRERALDEAKMLSASRRSAQRTAVGVLCATWIACVLVLYGFSHMLEATAGDADIALHDGASSHNVTPDAVLWRRFPRTVGRLTLNPAQVPAYALMGLWAALLLVSFVCAVIARCGDACSALKRCIK